MSFTTKFKPIVIALFAVAIVSFGYYKINQAEDNASIICDQQYALCTSATCIPDPNDSNKATCFCKVEQGKSFGQTSCKARRPYTDSKGVSFVTSTYSFAEYATKKAMFCPSSSPWSYCLDKSCTIDPKDPTKAICVCDVYRTGEFLTLGGNCDTSTCDTAYWSGASYSDTSAAMAQLAKALGLAKAPENYCPNTPPPAK